jgi:ATP-dependent Lhr-like helicase
VVDSFRESESGREICDAENLERLLRLLRGRSRPRFEALDVHQLPLFLARHQDVSGAGTSPREISEVLESLFGYPAPAGLWETDILPARLEPYYSAWLDALMAESDLLWFGSGRERLSFALQDELGVFQSPGEEAEKDARLDHLMPPDEEGTRLPYPLLAARWRGNADGLQAFLWSQAWEGRVSSSLYSTVRRGVLSRFKDEEGSGDSSSVPRSSGAALGRGRRRRWRRREARSGEWFRLPEATAPGDALEQEELNKDRVRQLLDRYGLLFRELLERELPALRWSRVFRSLRLMELSGELLSGQFFRGIPGLQFISPRAFRVLREGLEQDCVYWINALDPASPCALGLQGLDRPLPPRQASNHLVFHGPRLVLVSRRRGGELEIHVPPEHVDLGEYLSVLKSLLTRAFNPLRSVTIESINGERAARSAYLATLAEHFEVSRDTSSVKLRRRFSERDN